MHDDDDDDVRATLLLRTSRCKWVSYNLVRNLRFQKEALSSLRHPGPIIITVPLFSLGLQRGGCVSTRRLKYQFISTSYEDFYTLVLCIDADVQGREQTEKLRGKRFIQG